MFNLPDGADLNQIVSACLQKRNPALSLGKQINKGGTSVVYHIEGTDTPQTLKVMYTDLDKSDDFSTRKRYYKYFTEEVNIMREFKDPHIMPVLDSFQYVVTDGRIQEATEQTLKSNGYRVFIFVIMPEFQSLRDYHKKHPLTEQDMIQMTIDICEALQQCHSPSHRILHRDVKPDNIFVPLDSADRFILGDFGFCRRMEHNILPGAFTRVGTDGYTAPEILNGKRIPDGQYNSDLYALAASIHYLITGSPYKGYYDKKLALKKVSPAFYHVIYEKSLPKEPKDRYQNAGEMLNDLYALRGTRRTVFRNPWFLQAKQEMLANHYKQAIQIAQEGVSKSDEQGAMDCRRLLAYCQYHEDPQNPAVARTLEMLAGQGDDIARYLRAMMDIRDRSGQKMKTGFQNLRKSAEAGCVLAQYYYGHFLFGNYHELPAGIYDGTDPQQDGLRFLLQAVGTGFPPAAAYLQKVRTQMRLSPELADFLNRALEESPRLKDFLAELKPEKRKFIIDLL